MLLLPGIRKQSFKPGSAKAESDIGDSDGSAGSLTGHLRKRPWLPVVNRVGVADSLTVYTILGRKARAIHTNSTRTARCYLSSRLAYNSRPRQAVGEVTHVPKRGRHCRFRQSPYARLRRLPLSAVQLHDDFWQPKRQIIIRQVTLPAQYRICQETGRTGNFRRAADKIKGEFQGIFFNDSDIYKWLEAARPPSLLRGASWPP